MQLARRILDKLINVPILQQPASNGESFELSERELEVLGLIADGYTNHEIADLLFTTKRTIEGNRQALLDKSGMRNIVALVKYAVGSGLIS